MGRLGKPKQLMGDHQPYPFELNEGSEEELREVYGDSCDVRNAGDASGDVWQMPQKPLKRLDDTRLVPSTGRVTYRPLPQTTCPETGAKMKRLRRPTLNPEVSIYSTIKPGGPCRNCGYHEGWTRLEPDYSLCNRCWTHYKKTGLFHYAMGQPEAIGSKWSSYSYFNTVLLQQLLFDWMEGQGIRLPHMAWVAADKAIESHVNSSPLSFMSEDFLKKRWQYYQHGELIGPMIYRKALLLHPNGLPWHLETARDHIRPLWSPQWVTAAYFRAAFILFSMADERDVSPINGKPLYTSKAILDRRKHLLIARGPFNYRRRIIIGKPDEPIRAPEARDPDWQARAYPSRGPAQADHPEWVWKVPISVNLRIGKFIAKTVEKAWQPYLEPGETLWDRLELLVATQMPQHQDYVSREANASVEKRLAQLAGTNNSRPWRLLGRPWMPEEFQMQWPDRWKRRKGRVAKSTPKGSSEPWPHTLTEIMSL